MDNIEEDTFTSIKPQYNWFGSRIILSFHKIVEQGSVITKEDIPGILFESNFGLIR
jgi:hypothetical protein